MDYDYATERPWLLTDEGQRVFLKERDRMKDLLKTAGAFRLEEVVVATNVGDSFRALACIDRMVELGEIVCVRDECWAQYRVYTTPKGSNW